jgi:hypothetical protein
MKRGFLGSVFRGTAIVALCLSGLVGAAFAADTPPASAGQVNVLAISGNHWTDDVKLAAVAGDVSMRNSDCNFGAVYTENLTNGETQQLRDFSVSQLCTQPASISGLHLGVVSLRVMAGFPRAWTIATFDDDRGNFNNVRIDALPNALAVGAGKYVFYGIESGADPKHPRTTQLVLMAENGGDLAAAIRLFDEHGMPVGADIPDVSVRGWSIYTIKSDVRVGRAEVTAKLPNAGPATPASLFAIALTFDSRGGSPEVGLPSFVASQ